MGEFFRGWRRKAGYTAMLIAWVFMFGWIRSRTVADGLIRTNGQVRDSFVSIDGTLTFIRITPSWNSAAMLHLFGDDYRWRSTEISKDGRSDFDAHGVLHSPDAFESVYEVEWQWDWAGFTFGAEQFKPGVMPVHRLKIYSVPYWSIVIPLALLSAYLILWKPRKRVAIDNSFW